MKRIVFDVGACDGHSTIALLDENTEIYAFEPDPNCFPIVQKWTKNPQYHAYNKVVTDFDGEVDFNICPDMGCSSLLPFSPDIDKTWDVNNPAWGYKRVPSEGTIRFFRHTSQVKVEAIRLDTFIAQNSIQYIDILHVDTQGNDLKVLQSLGESIQIVRSGEIEVASEERLALYSGQATRDECVKFLEANGFHVELIKDNDPFCFEQNIRFCR